MIQQDKNDRQILINNAGFNHVGHFIHTDLQKEKDMITLHATFTTANIGYKALRKGKTALIAGMYNKLLVFSSKIIPSFIMNPLTKKILKA